MNIRIIIFPILILSLISCRPQPLDIDIPQQNKAIVISSLCPNEHTLYVSASYSISSLLAVLDTVNGQSPSLIPGELLIDSAVVTIRSGSGRTDTLRKITDGIWAGTDLQLEPGVSYQLYLHDCRKDVTATAVTTYEPEPVIDTLYPERKPGFTDTLTTLKLRIKNAKPGSHYLVAYNTMRHARENAIPLPRNTKALNVFTPKQVELFTVSGGDVAQSVTLQVSSTDTLLVHFGQVDKAYYEYLSAYKRTGALINQLTGEPINLPSNVMNGVGFFSLYQPLRRMYDLNKR